MELVVCLRQNFGYLLFISDQKCVKTYLFIRTYEKTY